MSARTSKVKNVPEGATVVVFGGTKSRPAKEVVLMPPKSNTIHKKRVQAIRLNVAGRKTRPPYLKMVKLAIASNKAHWLHGTSYAAIANYILQNYPTNPSNFRRLLRVTLSRAVTNNQLEKTGNRYKFTKAEWEKDKAAAARAQARERKVAPSGPTGTKSRPRAPPKKRTSASSSSATAPSKKAAAPKARKAPAPRKTTNTKGRSAGTQAAPTGNQGQAQGKLKWVWQYYDNGWFNYDPAASDVVEANYQDYLKNPGHSDVRAVHSGQWNYMVDFRQMMQQNIQHESHTRRKIRRVQLPIAEIHNRAPYAEDHFDNDGSSDDEDDDAMDE